ncbi:glutamate--tRNA ligase, partial [candidate division WWE3 bacterium]|nr:glutamate--tRNA ligase [candidate division WWE3 bacterium]
MQGSEKVRVRIAPSPTGENLHIGHANTALVSYIFAKQNNGRFIVRIEDTDRTRYVEGSIDRILESLLWLGLDFDEGPGVEGEFGPYIQSERLQLYREHAKKLVDKGAAYHCFCTAEELDQIRNEQVTKGLPQMYDKRCKNLSSEEVEERLKRNEPHVIRVDIPKEGTTAFTDMIRGEISFQNELIDDQVLIKSDGFPTYHLAVVVDDHLMEISHVIRGEDWISSTPKHVLLYQAFGWELPKFAHLPLLRNKDKSKLSKRKNPVFMSWYREQGFLPQAIVNYLGTLLSPVAEGDEIFGIQELVRDFDITKVNITGPAWDQDKLKWINGVYIRNLTVEDLSEKLVDGGFVPDSHTTDRAYLAKVVALEQERLKLLSEFWEQNQFFWETPEVPVELATSVLSEEVLTSYLPEVISALSELDVSSWSSKVLEEVLREVQTRRELKPREAFLTLHIAVSGQK